MRINLMRPPPLRALRSMEFPSGTGYRLSDKNLAAAWLAESFSCARADFLCRRRPHVEKPRSTGSRPDGVATKSEGERPGMADLPAVGEPILAQLDSKWREWRVQSLDSYEPNVDCTEEEEFWLLRVGSVPPALEPTEARLRQYEGIFRHRVFGARLPQGVAGWGSA